ncbi:MAG: DUF1700 domain-containing protein [Candidatus Choladocola sp.]|nr:DUF1700 domain-containing protein [Candidatus Choladocola sp.]
MKKEEYLKKLKYQLMDLPGEDLSQIEDFYTELIYDGLEQGFSEEEILEKFESPEEVARKIRADYGGIVVYTAKAKSRESTKDKKQEYESSELIHTVRVETENLRVRIKTVEEGPVRAYFKPKEGQDFVTFEEKDGVFSFHHEMKSGFYLNWLNLFMDFNILVLEVPMNFSGNLLINTKNGSVRASGLGSLSVGEFFSNNGKIKIENSCVEQMQIKSNNARIELSNVRGDVLEASAGNGLISVRECRFPQKLSLQTQNGAVTGRNLISDHIMMQTSNGFVTGTIIGNQSDYNINSSTRNGFNNLENVFEEDRQKSLLAKTHNGRIQIEFTL